MRISGMFRTGALLLAVCFVAAFVGTSSAEAAQSQVTGNPLDPPRYCDTIPAPARTPPTTFWNGPPYPGPVSQWLPSPDAVQSPAGQLGYSYQASASDSTSNACY